MIVIPQYCRKQSFFCSVGHLVCIWLLWRHEVPAQCPLTCSLGELPGCWDWLRYPGLPPVFTYIAFSPFALNISVFSIHSSSDIGFHSCFFFTTDVSAPILSTLHLLMVSFQAPD